MISQYKRSLCVFFFKCTQHVLLFPFHKLPRDWLFLNLLFGCCIYIWDVCTQRTFWSQFSVSTFIWVLEVKLRAVRLGCQEFLLAEPSCWSLRTSSCCVAQVRLELLGSSDSPISLSQVAEALGPTNALFILTEFQYLQDMLGLGSQHSTVQVSFVPKWL